LSIFSPAFSFYINNRETLKDASLWFTGRSDALKIKETLGKKACLFGSLCSAMFKRTYLVRSGVTASSSLKSSGRMRLHRWVGSYLRSFHRGVSHGECSKPARKPESSPYQTMRKERMTTRSGVIIKKASESEQIMQRESRRIPGHCVFLDRFRPPGWSESHSGADLSRQTCKAAVCRTAGAL